MRTLSTRHGGGTGLPAAMMMMTVLVLISAAGRIPPATAWTPLAPARWIRAKISGGGRRGGGGGGGDTGTTTSPLDAPMDAATLLRTRRTINDFHPALPGGWEGAVTRAIEAATCAPNHRRTEPWRFHLLGPEAVGRVCRLNSDLVAEKKGEEAGRKKLERWLAMPGWLVVTRVRGEGEGEGSMEAPAGTTREDYAAVCCAVQNLCLSLHSEGVGTKWTTGPVNFDPRFADAAGLPGREEVVGTVWFGEAARTPPAPRKRLALDDVLTRHP